MVNCDSCNGEFREADAIELNSFSNWLSSFSCPACHKERNRKEPLVCNNCGNKEHFQLTKATCYSLNWQCDICFSFDIIDPDCTPTLDDDIETEGDYGRGF